MCKTPPTAITDAERVLRDLLDGRGIGDVASASVGAAWDVFQEYVTIPFDVDGPGGDGVLYQSGVFSFYGEAEFYIDFVRQFEVTADGEYDHYEQVHCEFRFPVTDETRSFGTFTRWWFADQGTDTWAQFLAAIQARPEFEALRSVPPRAMKVEQEQV